MHKSSKLSLSWFLHKCVCIVSSTEAVNDQESNSIIGVTRVECLWNMFLSVQLLVQEKGQVQEEIQPTRLERRGHVSTQQLKA